MYGDGCELLTVPGNAPCTVRAESSRHVAPLRFCFTRLPFPPLSVFPVDLPVRLMLNMGAVSSTPLTGLY